ncbi:MAG: peptidoglycan bridge formation glycyltransferase FemA/FemB family protein [Actinomycetota bacterium]|nr:peptidoglycan bridge formation glycyltransferase FemA/FemB family protein [Actinomycetota bacterium]
MTAGVCSEVLDRTDVGWDELVDAAVGGDYRQSRGWAEAKQLLGRESVRIVVRKDADIVAGAQLFTQRFGRLGAIGYVPRGPWLSNTAEAWAPAAVHAVLERTRGTGVRLICIAAPDTPVPWEQLLRDRGFMPTRFEATPGISTLVDLRVDEDALLARMHRKTRYNVRLAQRRGVVVREGGLHEVEVFYDLYLRTSARRSFEDTESRTYFETLCRALHGGGHVRLVFAEVDGRPVSAMVLILFGGVATYYRGAWSGEHADRHPNEALHFGAMRIAQDAGCHLYDFEDITVAAARAVREHGRVDRSVDALSAFKLSFGGDVVEFPAPQIYAHGAAARMAYRLVSSEAGRSAMRTVVRRLRNVSGGG